MSFAILWSDNFMTWCTVTLRLSISSFISLSKKVFRLVIENICRSNSSAFMFTNTDFNKSWEGWLAASAVRKPTGILFPAWCCSAGGSASKFPTFLITPSTCACDTFLSISEFTKGCRPIKRSMWNGVSEATWPLSSCQDTNRTSNSRWVENVFWSQLLCRNIIVSANVSNVGCNSLYPTPSKSSSFWVTLTARAANSKW